MGLVSKLKTLASPHQRALRSYRGWVERLPLNQEAVLLEQQNGLALDGNIYCILRELLQNGRYRHLTVRFVAASDRSDAFSAELAARGLKPEIVVRGTAPFMHALATSGTIITDNVLPLYFVKRPGQVVVNTWHGIPLKTLGRREATDAVQTSNVQRNLALADYLLMPNPTMEQRMVRDYMLRGLSTGTVIPLGYPRNEALLTHGATTGDESATTQRRYAWLPTFRGVGDARGKTPQAMQAMLSQLDELLHDDEVLYLKLHLVEQEAIDLSRYAHIVPAPTNCELYDFLATCDALVTDYSSVLFDFPLGGGKVVLFPYDQEQYLAERGLYDSLDTLPFPQATSVAEVVAELRASKAYDEAPSLAKWWPAPTAGATAALCERFFGNGAPLPDEHQVEQPQKPTVLLYSELGCDLQALREELLQLSETHEPRLAFPWKRGVGHEDFLLSLPDCVTYTPLKGDMLTSLPEKVQLKLGKAGSALALDQRRTFGEARFDVVKIHDGSDQRWVRLMNYLARNAG